MTLVNKKSILRSAGIVSGTTLLSRILGFIRDAVIAGIFGAGYMADLFFIAFRFPNLVRKMFSEGSLSIAFIPYFIKYYQHRGEKEAFSFACSYASFILLIVSICILIIYIITPSLVTLLIPGISGSLEKSVLVISMTRIMLPYVVIVSVSALAMGVLHALGYFFIPSLLPVILNVFIILSAIISQVYYDNHISALAYGVLLGGFFQIFILIPVLVRRGILVFGNLGYYVSEIKILSKKTIPSVIGASSYQLNIFAGTILAAFLKEGSVSYLYYADRLVQFPLALFALSGAIASLPILSGLAASGNFQRFEKTISGSIKMLVFLIIPSMTGLIVLNEVVVSVLFERGEFSSLSTQLTARALLFYGLGLPAVAVLKYIITVYNALSDIRSTVRITLFSVSINLLISSFLMQFLGFSGVALGTSVTVYLELFLLVSLLEKKHGFSLFKPLVKPVLKAAGASCIMGGVLHIMLSYISKFQNDHFLFEMFQVMLLIFTGIFIYIVISGILKNNELKLMLTFFHRE